jgi:hypothetical protein
VTVTVQLKEDPSKTATFTVTVKAASDSGEGQVPSTKPDETKPGAGHETKAPHGVLSSTGSAVIGVVVLVAMCALAGIGITLWRKRFA